MISRCHGRFIYDFGIRISYCRLADLRIRRPTYALLWFALEHVVLLRNGATEQTSFPNALRTAPGHPKDANAGVYATPPLDSNDFIDNQPPAPPLVLAKLPNVDASGRWWYAGDYMKYVETTSYTTALMEIGIRDFPTAMGSEAPLRPPTPPSSISYADKQWVRQRPPISQRRQSLASAG